jgi:hypothetical protein
MSLSVVPSVFQAPLYRPKRGNLSEEEYSVALLNYESQLAARFSMCCTEKRYTALDFSCESDEDEEEDEEGDEEEDEEEDEDEDSLTTNTDTGTEYDVYEDDDEDESVCEEDTMNHRILILAPEQLHRPTEDGCPVCLEEFTWANCVTTNCDHSFCVTCYEKYTKRSCPCCCQQVNMLTTYQTAIEKDKV